MEGRRAPARTQRVSPRTARRLARGLLVPPLLLMAVRAEAPPAGHHLFRQTHVAANIETYVRDGLSLTPRTYNLDAPYSLFDFPAYQLLVAWLCRSFSLPALPTARAVSIACFALTLLVLDRLLERTQTPELESSLALAFFAYAPLCVFYFSAPMLDGVALLAALVSLLAFTHWDGEPDRRDPRCFAVMAGAGAFSALVKSPVYLPALPAILWRRFRERGWRLPVAVLGITAAWSWFGYRAMSAPLP